MAHAELDFDDHTWDCSCGVADQHLQDFWDADELTCAGCGAVFDLELDGGTEEGFRRTPVEVAS